MKTRQTNLDALSLNYSFENNLSLENILFIDIETTGFTARSSYLYMIGCVYYKENSWKSIQWLASEPTQEAEILTSFIEFIQPYSHLVHFNGDNFDLPFLKEKCLQHNLSFPSDAFTSIDIYRRISYLKKFLRLADCKQKTIEQFLGINRLDTYNGGELITLYHNYVETQEEQLENILFQHNADDIAGLLMITPCLAYYDLFNMNVHVKKAQASTYKDINNSHHKELILNVVLPSPLPKEILFAYSGCYFKADNLNGAIRVPITEKELKYFYANYKDYYYLPNEDLALHKSVGSFVDKSNRVPASATTCYTRKNSTYLPQWGIIAEPFYKENYKDKQLYFELTDELKKDRTFFTKYANHILAIMPNAY